METLTSSFRHPQLLHAIQPLNIRTVNVKIRRPQPMVKAKNIIKKNTNPPLPPSPLTVSKILNKLDDFISTYLEQSPLPESIDPKKTISGHFAPVDNELPPTPCEVDGGPLPPCLDGAYIRNGPNPQFLPKGRPYHLFDGDGMLQMIRISGGGKSATFCSRYVKTHKHKAERENGFPFVPSPFASFNGLAASVARAVLTLARVVVAGQFDPVSRGFGSANTSLALFPCRGLFALCECDLPYEVKVTEEGDIVTLGRRDFDNTNRLFFNMTAHPKIDRRTGQVFAYRYNFTRPYLTYFRIGSEGRKQHDVHINSVNECTIIHDFAVTENYAVFPDTQIVVNNPLRALIGGRSPVAVDSGKAQRLGVIRKYAEDDSGVWWAEAPGLNMLHCVNAWEEDGGATIVVVATNALEVDQLFQSIHLARLTMEKITIDVKAETVEREQLSAEVLDFGVINPAYAGKKNRYAYAAMIGSDAVVGVVKIDLTLTENHGRGDGCECVVASRLYGPGFCGGEPFFAPKEPDNPSAEEDDGYLVVYVNDENNGESKFLVMNAKSVTLDLIATVKLPCRIPSGFHGLFVSDSDLKKLL
ncbi:hypothetical protein ABFS83_05G120800 [Erythranthe nasuta]